VFKEAMDSPVHAEAFHQFAYLLIDNSVATVYNAAKLLGYSADDTKRALTAAGREAFTLIQEGIEGMASSLDMRGDRTLN
jgi:hypothetical protein